MKSAFFYNLNACTLFNILGSVRFFAFKKLILLFSKDTLNWSKVFQIITGFIIFLNKCFQRNKKILPTPNFWTVVYLVLYEQLIGA